MSLRVLLVEDFEDLIPVLRLPDPDDRHVLAAAIRGRADVIVTRNLAHFPEVELSRYGVEAQHPDDFVTHLIHLEPRLVIAAVAEHRASLERPPKAVEEYLCTLEDQGLLTSAALLREHSDEI